MIKLLQEGTLLKSGDYRIECVLGQGGFGITYLATQVGLNRKVAIKEFFMKEYCNRDATTSHVSVGSDGSKELVSKFKTKFIKEAQTIAGLENNNIIRIHDVFEENGTAYYVMEYLSNGDLRSRIPSDGMPEAEAVGYIKQLCSALSYIHSKNILHLDIKPGNVLFRQSGEAVLIDFGVSKHYEEDGDSQTTTTTPVCVSHGYAPTEQYETDGVSSFSAATDIYALGATLYCLIVGERPPKASVVLNNGLPSKPSGVSSGMWHVIESSMRPAKKDRPQSIPEFLQLLDGVSLDSEETELTDLGEESSSDASTSKGHKRKVFFLSIISLSLIGTIIVLFLFINNRRYEYHYHYDGSENGYEWVDLGLSVKWATCNVGASSPEGYGSYFAWGETSPKSDYDWDTYKYSRGSWEELTKYCDDSQFGYNGYTDNKTTLDLNDDAARANWGGSWRMPTYVELDELKTKCTWTWTTLNGINGYKVTSKSNGNSIFLPAAGYRFFTDDNYVNSAGFYWSSSLGSDGPYDAYCPGFYSGYVDWSSSLVRYYGRTVRAVCP